MNTPIDLAPPSRARRWAARVQFALAVIIVAAVVVQVYLIGGYIFGAGQGALDAHRTVGFSTHLLEVLTFVAALVSGRERVLSLALAVLGTVQLSLAGGESWVGGLHPLFALVVLGLAGQIALRLRGGQGVLAGV